MRRYIVAVLIMLVPRVVVARLTGQVQPSPGPGTGVVTVTGTVNLGEVPPLRSTQAGEWRVSVNDAPPTVRAPLNFVRAGYRYEVAWTAAERDTLRVEQVGPGGWVRATLGERSVWVNLDMARWIEESR